LLKYFLQHEGEVVSRDQLLTDVWGFEKTPSTRSVDNYILSLRKKIEDDAAHPRHILTFRGAGYKFIR
jgi:DNA-binding response OmpR family regulator